jgi:hypothetical protein
LLTIVSDSSKTNRVQAAMLLPSSAALTRLGPSIRRTSHIDMHVQGNGREVILDGAARDIATTSADSDVVGSATVSAHLDHEALLISLELDPVTNPVEPLLGRQVGPGFREAVHSAFADDVAAGTPLALLLDDLPVAALISGYARLYTGDIPGDEAAMFMKSDICSGWRSDGTMLVSVRAGGGVPVTIGPSAPTIADDMALDHLGWHAIGQLPPGSMRRRRLVDVRDFDDVWNVQAMFRDTHVDATGTETVLHEYTLTARVDRETGVFTECAAVPRVLPWVECPVAASSADRLVGQPVAEVRNFVKSDLRGVSTCTHLNDLLRSLGDVPSLAARIP